MGRRRGKPWAGKGWRPLGPYGGLVVGAIVLGALLRLVNLGSQSFDGDELLTAWYTHVGFGDLLSLVSRIEKNPYSYSILMWLWAHVFGHGEVALRLVSALAGIATIPVGTYAALVLVGRRAAAATSVLLAVNPFLVWYSQQARPYALFGLFAASALLCFARALQAQDKSSAKALVGWSLSSALALATNYFAVFFIAVEAAWLLWHARRTASREDLRRVLAALVVPVLIGVALIPLALTQRSNGPPGDVAGVSLLTRLAQIPKSFLIAYSAPAKVAVTLMAGVLVVLATVPVLQVRGRSRDGSILAAYVALGATLLPLIAAVLGEDFVAARYLLAALIPAAIVAACGAVQRTWSLTALGGLACLQIILVFAVMTDPALQRQDYQGLARALGPVTVVRAIAISPNEYAGAFDVYFRGARPLSQNFNQRVGEVDLVAVANQGKFSSANVHPPRPPTPQPPPGFSLVSRANAATYTVIRYRARYPRRVNAFFLAAATPGRSEGGVGLWTQRPGATPTWAADPG